MNLLHAWLVYDRQGAKRNASYIEMHKTIGHSMGIEFELKLTDSIPDDLSLTPKPAFALIRTICPELSRQLESDKIPIFQRFEDFPGTICHYRILPGACRLLLQCCCILKTNPFSRGLNWRMDWDCLGWEYPHNRLKRAGCKIPYKPGTGRYFYTEPL